MLPKVSIILSTYKSEPYLLDWLNNVVLQTAWPFSELIVVANSPSEYELNLYREFSDKWTGQFKFFSIERESLYKSWNRCLNTAEGQYLAIANVDDLRTKEGLMDQINLLDLSPDYLFCYANFNVCSRFGSKYGRLVDVKNENIEEFTRGMLLGPFFVWRKTNINAIKYFDEQFLSGGDFDFSVRLALSGKGIKLNSSVGFYLDAGSGLSTGSNLQPIERTVIELRYGIYDKVDYNYINQSLNYNIRSILYDEKLIPISNLFPQYEDLLLRRKKELFISGIKKYYLKNLLDCKNNKFFCFLRKILTKLKSYI